jgi:hypothetical protein
MVQSRQHQKCDATVTVKGNDSLKQPGTLYILAVAVNKYRTLQFDLRYAVADADDFRRRDAASGDEAQKLMITRRSFRFRM